MIHIHSDTYTSYTLVQTYTKTCTFHSERHDLTQLIQCQWQIFFLYTQLYLLSHEYFAVYYEWNKTQLRICHCYKYIMLFILIEYENPSQTFLQRSNRWSVDPLTLSLVLLYADVHVSALVNWPTVLDQNTPCLTQKNTNSSALI